jgi:hypothetical protein
MYEAYVSVRFLVRFLPPSLAEDEVLAALAGAFEAAGALEACEAGALEATDDLGGWRVLAMGGEGECVSRE